MHSSLAAAVKPCCAYCVISFIVSIACTPLASLNIGCQSSSNQPSPMVLMYQCASLSAASTGLRQLIVPARIGVLNDFARSRYSAMVFGGGLPACVEQVLAVEEQHRVERVRHQVELAVVACRSCSTESGKSSSLNSSLYFAHRSSSGRSQPFLAKVRKVVSLA